MCLRRSQRRNLTSWVSQKLNCHFVITAIIIVVHTFGPTVGPLMHEHAHLEQGFKQNNIGPDGKMTALDDEFLPEEAKKAAIKIRKTTANLVRHF
jgi:hypothetical protein